MYISNVMHSLNDVFYVEKCFIMNDSGRKEVMQIVSVDAIGWLVDGYYITGGGNNKVGMDIIGLF